MGTNVAANLHVSEWGPFWRNELGARGCRPTTVIYRMKALGKLTEFWDGPPEALTSAVLLQWREEMRSPQAPRPSGRGRKPLPTGYAVATINGYLAAVRTFLRWLADEGVITEPPRVRLLSERNEPVPAIYDSDELRKLAAGAASTRQGRSQFEVTRDGAIVALLQDSGLRASECAGLLIEHLDLAARQVYVHPDVAKGGRPRTVTFGFTTARLLNRYLLARRKHQCAFMPEVFLGRQGPASYPLVRRVVKSAGERAGISGARPHLLRHSWAHHMKDAGVDLETLMSLGGWSSTEMPMRYGRSGREARAVAAYQRLGSPVDRQGRS